MTWVFLLLVLMAFGGLVINGVYRFKTGGGSADEGACIWPAATVIVPVAGNAPAIAGALSSVLALDYPDFEVVFVTENHEDSAAQIIARALADHPHNPRFRHVVSSTASFCSQKNQSLLAGVAAADPRCKIFAFADCTHIVPAHWLRRMARPIIAGKAPVTSGYHRILPGNDMLALHGRSITVLVLYLLQFIPLTAQVWGGNMAMSRELFESLAGNLWASTLTDDVGLTRRLREKRIRYTVVLAAESTTPLNEGSLASWAEWTERQWLHLKFTMPECWFFAGLACHLLTITLALALTKCAFAAVGWTALADALPFILFIISMGVIFSLAKPLHLGRCSYLAWACAGLLAAIVASVSHLRGLFARQMIWGRKCYTISTDGFVSAVKEHVNS